MSMTPPSPHDCLGAAQRDALRMHGIAVPPAGQPPVRRAGRPWLLAGLVLMLGATSAVLAARQFGPAAAASSAIDAVVPKSAEASSALPAPASATLAAAHREQRIEREGDAWVIDVAAMSREQAAQRLAALTGGELLERPELLAQAPAVTLNWRGRDAGEAWRQLLGDEVGHLVQCAAQACRVWVLGLVERSVAVGTAPSRPVAAAAVAPAGSGSQTASTDMPMPAVLANDAAPTPMQPDPPGLFPSPAEGD